MKNRPCLNCLLQQSHDCFDTTFLFGTTFLFEQSVLYSQPLIKGFANYIIKVKKQEQHFEGRPVIIATHNIPHTHIST